MGLDHVMFCLSMGTLPPRLLAQSGAAPRRSGLSDPRIQQSLARAATTHRVVLRSPSAGAALGRTIGGWNRRTVVDRLEMGHAPTSDILLAKAPASQSGLFAAVSSSRSLVYTGCRSESC